MKIFNRRYFEFNALKINKKSRGLVHDLISGIKYAISGLGCAAEDIWDDAIEITTYMYLHISRHDWKD